MDIIEVINEEKMYKETIKTLGIYHGYSFLNDTVKHLKEKRLQLKISLNQMSNSLYGNRYYVNYLSKIEKGEVPNVSYEVIARMYNYLGEIEYHLNKK